MYMQIWGIILGFANLSHPLRDDPIKLYTETVIYSMLSFYNKNLNSRYSHT